MATTLFPGAAGAADRPEGHSFATHSVVHAQHGMVAAAHPLAVEIGLAVLKDEGSAVDAAIAVNAALALMEPTGTLMTNGGVVHLESGVSAEIKRELVRRGHRIQETTPVVFGGYQAIRRNPQTGVYAGATESRKDGMAAGY